MRKWLQDKHVGKEHDRDIMIINTFIIMTGITITKRIEFVAYVFTSPSPSIAFTFFSSPVCK